MNLHIEVFQFDRDEQMLHLCYENVLKQHLSSLPEVSKGVYQYIVRHTFIKIHQHFLFHTYTI